EDAEIGAHRRGQRARVSRVDLDEVAARVAQVELRDAVRQLPEMVAVDGRVECAERACTLVHGREVVDGDAVVSDAAAASALEEVDLRVADTEPAHRNA